MVVRIDVFSHSFMVTELSPRELVATKNFMRGLIQYEPVVEAGRKEMVPARVFASSPEDRRYFRMHINLLKGFHERLVYERIDPREIETHTHIFEVPDGAQVEHIVKHLHNPRDTQPDIIQYIKDPGDNKVVTLQPGGGKALEINTPVQTPTGWLPIGSLKVGDEVIARDGTPTKVTGVYPQGKLPLYRVQLVDRRYVDVCGDHLWKVFASSGTEEVINTSKLISRFDTETFAIPAVMPTPAAVVMLNELLTTHEHYLTGESRDATVCCILDVLGEDVDSAVNILRSNGYYVRKPVRMHTLQDVTGVKPNNGRLAISQIYPVDSGEAVCISVEHPEKLFVVKDYIVTHNTLIAKHCIADFGVRTAGIMRGSFIDRWVPDLEESFDFKRGELLVIRGSDSMTALMEMGLEGDLNAKVIMISINTFTNYLKEYESKNGATEQYPIPPGIFFEKLGIPFGIFDEAHQFPHQVMKMFSYMHIGKFLSLSATLNTQDKFMNGMYEVMYPRDIRFDGGKFNAFVVAAVVKYSLVKPNSIRCKGFQGAYSHTAFEASLMLGKNKKLLENYLALINWCVKQRFVDVMEKGQKAIVFCGTINFCTLVQKHLQKLYPHLKVVRYVSKDKMSVMDGADIIVSTVLSAGTAVDIVGLRYNLLTTAIDSQQSNEQTMGRTRVLKDWPGTDVVFEYFCCVDIDKHVRYHSNKLEYFRGRVKSHGTVMAPISI